MTNLDTQGNDTNDTFHVTFLAEWLDYVLILIIVALVATAAYHQYFFGDELTPWSCVEKYKDFWSALHACSEYKPRFIFNAIWIAIADFGGGRYWAALVVVVAESFTAGLIYYLVRRSTPNQARLAAWLAVWAFVSSRFGIMIWFDYIAGIIETLSFAFFLAGLVVLAWPKDALSRNRMILGAVLFMAAVFVHERYIAPIFAVGLGLAVLRRETKTIRTGLIAIAVVPGLSFWLANSLVGAHPIMTGTANQQVSIGSGTFKAFITYLCNVVLQTNYGHNWFVGMINYGTPAGNLASIGTAVVFVTIYIFSLINLKKQYQLNTPALSVALAMLALVAVASLPGLARQEARWMYPVLGLFILFIALKFSKTAAIISMCAIFAINGFYEISGSNNNIYNVVSSRTAEELGSFVRNIGPIGHSGVVVGGEAMDWILSTDKRQFGEVNFSGGRELFSLSTGANKTSESFQYALVKVGESKQFVPTFRQISASAAHFLIDPNSPHEIAQHAQLIGGEGLWNRWRLNKNILKAGALNLSPGADGFLEMPADAVDGQILIYTASAIGGASQPMRLQVNWEKENGDLISASITVVTVGAQARRYAALVSAPPGAKQALIYATLHDGATGVVRLESVAILSTKGFS